MSDIKIRQAEITDSRTIARLFEISSEGVADYIWSQMADDADTLIEVGTRRYARQDEDFSYENCVVAEEDERVIGMVHSFPIYEVSEPDDDADPVLRPYMELEFPNSLYISGVALFPEYREQGIGTRLLEEAEKRARKLKLKKLSLIVFEENEDAHRLYKRLGYSEVDRRAVVPHAMIEVKKGDAILMAKDL